MRARLGPAALPRPLPRRGPGVPAGLPGPGGASAGPRVARGGRAGGPGVRRERAGAGFFGSRTSWANKTGGRAISLFVPRGARSGAATGSGTDGAPQPRRRARRHVGVGRAAGGRERGAPGRCYPQAVLRRAGEAARQLRGAGHGEVTSPAPLGFRPRPASSCWPPGPGEPQAAPAVLASGPGHWSGSSLPCGDSVPPRPVTPGRDRGVPGPLT